VLFTGREGGDKVGGRLKEKRVMMMKEKVQILPF